MKTSDTDTGYSWVALAAASVIYMVSIGFQKCYGVLFTEFQHHFSSVSSSVAAVGSVRVFFVCITTPFANYFCVQKSFRLVMFIGGCVFGLSYLFCSFVNQMELMYLTYSVIGGIGVGMISGPSNTVVSFFFRKRRSLANGVVVCGSGIGLLLFPYVYRYLFDTYGLNGGLLLLSGIAVQTVVAACLLRQPYILQHRKRKEDIENNEENVQNKNGNTRENNTEMAENKQVLNNSKLKEMFKKIFKFDIEFLANKKVLIMIILFGIIFLPHTALYFMIPARIENLGFGKQHSATSVSIMGISEVVALLFFSWFLDFKIMSPKLLFVLNTVIGGISCLLVPLIADLYNMWVVAVFAGIFPGSIVGLFPLILIEEVGLEKLPAAFGVMSMFRAIPLIPGHPFLGYLEDITGSWNMSFIVVGALQAFCGVVMLFIWYQCRKQNAKNAKNIIDKPNDINSKINENEQIRMLDVENEKDFE